MGSLAIFAGGFGSGKSEVAINFAIDMASKSQKIVFADLDLVNPFFASRDAREKLISENIRLVAPGGELAFGDVPNLPTDIIALMKQDNDMLIDLAGDEVGSLVIGYLSNLVVERGDYQFYLVINPYRPFAGELESIKELRQHLEKAGLIKFTGIISNPNMVEETNLDLVLKGHRRVVEFAAKLELPVKYLTVEERIYNCLPHEYRSIAKKITLYLRPGWLHGSGGGK
ncbi:MAG: hypothetical protein WC109_06380 [Syntrophomonadaceae bacterium]|nr:hypothetical protein [Syntrophomonadaceae bacterium]MDD3898316.1 hypothetical protein [Syntrophomonadaceae bacterium]MDD4562201.1 hypothetical protein [Syntrophomonadaceae bacterium]